MNVEPLGEYVLLEALDESEKKTETGLIIKKDNEHERPQKGKVVAVGTDEDIKVKAEDIVLFRKYSPEEVEVDSKKYLLIKNKDILAVVRNGQA